MARPSRATITAATPGGISFQYLTDNYRSRAARAGNVEVLEVLVSWADSAIFNAEAVGYTTFTTGLPTLKRNLPLECPTRRGLYCSSCDLTDFGAYPERSDFWDNVGLSIAQDWCIYRMVFERQPISVVSDSDLATRFGNREQFRFCTFKRRYTARERRHSGFPFEYQKKDGTWAAVPDESGFIPDYALEYVIGWLQIPVGAVPEANFSDQILTVNDGLFQFREPGYKYEAGSLLFKGPLSDIEAYQGADGSWYEDLFYVFAFQRGGWNFFLRPDLVGDPPKRDYGRIRRRNAAGEQPAYPPSNFQKLFTPGGG